MKKITVTIDFKMKAKFIVREKFCESVHIKKFCEFWRKKN